MADDTSTLLSLLSHELRGPLGVVRGYLRLLTQANEPASEQGKTAIAAAMRATDRLVEILDETSLLAHLRLGDIALESKRLTVASLLDAAVQASQIPSGSSVALSLAPLADATLAGDQARLAAALATLITAVARAQGRACVIDVSSAPAHLDEAPVVTLRISPTAVGEDAATEAALNQKRGGHGLLIPIAATIVTMHGGRVRELVEGDRGVGVVVTLPLA